MKYAHLNGEQLLGWYDSEIHTNIPTPNIEVSEQTWQQAINNGANAYVNDTFTTKDFSTEEQKKQIRIQELKKLLSDTDFKVLPDYDKPNEDIKALRAAWRNEIRNLGG